MDYNNGVHLAKHQWDNIQAPLKGLHLFEDEGEGESFIETNKNKKISSEVENGIFRLYPLNDIRSIVKDKNEDIYFSVAHYSAAVLNFSRTSIIKNDLLSSVNDPHTCALGSFTYAYHLEGEYLHEENQIAIEQVWQVINDVFDFEGIQPLGSWHNSIFAPLMPIELINLTNFEMYNYFNSTFRDFRTKTGIGFDFRIIGRRVVPKHIDKILLHNHGTEYK
jgi:hypothetical protein